MSIIILCGSMSKGEIDNEEIMSEKVRARPGFEPGTPRTLSENHTPRPTSQMVTKWPRQVTTRPVPARKILVQEGYIGQGRGGEKGGGGVNS